MKFNREQNPIQKADGAMPEHSPTETKKKGTRSYKVAAAIITVFVAHFAWQFSFVQKEKLRIADDLLNEARLEVLTFESQPDNEVAAAEPDLAANRTAVEEVVKKVAPVKYSPPENKTPPELKKKTARQPTSERLRRAEKLLTGF